MERDGHNGVPFQCGECGEPIGVYEPLIAMLDAGAVETSRAAGAGPELASSECLHLACFERTRRGTATVRAAT